MIPISDAVGEILFEGLSILIADDEEANYELLRLYLEDTGANLLFANNGFEAVETCKTNTVHLVLMDIRMPVMNGIEAARTIKQFSSIPVIAVSAYTSDIGGLKNEENCFDHYMEKPVFQHKLIDNIKKVLSIQN